MGKTIEDGNAEDSFPLILETSAVVSENRCETRKMGCGGEEGKTGCWSGRKRIQSEFQPKRKQNQVGADSAKSRSVEPDPNGSRSSKKLIGDRSGQKLSRPNQRLKRSSPRHTISKNSRLLNTRKRPSRRTTTDNKGQGDWKSVT